MKERLQKILARAGHGSRRSAETLITDGRVTVNGVSVTKLGTQADSDVDRIEVDGTLLQTEAAPPDCVAMNKPSGFLTTAHDPQGRRTVMDLLPPAMRRHVLPIGRLDRDTEGLLLFTNDGELAHHMAHPRYQIEKEYYAEVKGMPARDALERLRDGIEIEGRMTTRATVDVAPPRSGFTAHTDHVWLRLVIHEGRRRQVRLMCAAVGHPVRTLLRTRIGPITLARLQTGKTRHLSQGEIAELKSLVGLAEEHL